MIEDTTKVILIAAAGILTSSCLGFFGYQCSKPNKTKELTILKELNAAYREYNNTRDEISIGRSAIKGRLDSLVKELAEQTKDLPVASKFTAANSSESQFNSTASQTRELFRTLEKLLRSYPEVDSTHIKIDDYKQKLDYVQQSHKALIEHHAHTRQIADLFFVDLEASLYPGSSKTCIKMRI